MVSLSYFFILLLLCHCALFASTFKLSESTWRVWWLRALLFGVIYDNSMLLLSSCLATPDYLIFPNRLRWLLHSMILPFLAMFCYSALCHIHKKLSGITYRAVFILITATAISYGIYFEFILLNMAPSEFHDPLHFFEPLTRFASVNSSPPWATIAINFLTIFVAGYFAYKTRWPWFLIGAVSIFVVNGAFAASPYGFFLGNIMEVLFIAGLLATEKFIQQSLSSR